MILPDSCPACKANLEGQTVQEWERAITGSEAKCWSRVQLVVENSKAKCFRCPDCEAEWDIPWLPKEPKAQDLP
jgi:hypothetical protein